MVFGSIMANGISFNGIPLNGILNGISVNDLSTVFGSIMANGICSPFSGIPSGRRSRGRPKQRWRDNIQGDTKKYRLTEDMAQDRKYWMTQILAGPAQGDGQER